MEISLILFINFKFSQDCKAQQIGFIPNIPPPNYASLFDAVAAPRDNYASLADKSHKNNMPEATSCLEVSPAPGSVVLDARKTDETVVSLSGGSGRPVGSEAIPQGF